MKATICSPKTKDPANVRVPASKSLSHRALIAAALCEGTSRIRGVAENQDTIATELCLRRLGAKIEKDGDITVVKGIGSDLSSMFSAYDESLIDCGESGSTLRFLLPLFAQSGKTCRFTGHGKLMERPQSVYEDIYKSFGASWETDNETKTLTVKGTLKPGEFEIRGDVSSQFITGLLFLLPLLEKDSRLVILPPFESASYVDLTIETLTASGIKIEMHTEYKGSDSLTIINIPGRQKYQPFCTEVSSDWSGAAFFAVLALTAEMPVTLTGADTNSRQGDKAILEFCKGFGASIKCSETENAVTVMPPKGRLKAIKADISDCPDLGPVLFAAAAKAEGTSVFTGISRLRIKESDRVSCMQKELEKLGCKMRADENTAWVEGIEHISGEAELCGHNDHRIVMALSVLCASSEDPHTISGSEAVAKSYPDFFKDLASCGAGVSPGE